MITVTEHYSTRIREYISAFDAVMNGYDDARTANSSVSSEGFYAGLTSEAGRATSTHKAARPSPSDLIADVEITARRILQAHELALFSLLFIDQVHIPRTVQTTQEFKRARGKIKRKIGRAFIARHIYPLSDYFGRKELK